MGEQLFICNYGIAGNLIKSEMYKVGQACSQCPDGTTCSTRYPGLCTGEPSPPLTVRPPLWPWELPEGFPTSGPLDPDKPLVTGFVDISGNPDAVIDPPDVGSERVCAWIVFPSLLRRQLLRNSGKVQLLQSGLCRPIRQHNYRQVGPKWQAW